MEKELSIYRFRSLKKEPSAHLCVFIFFVTANIAALGLKIYISLSRIFLRHKHSLDGYYNWLCKQENDTDSESGFGLAWSE